MRDPTLLATGSEVSLAMDVRKILGEKGLSVAVVSMPCWQQFERQPNAYRDEVLGTAPRFAIEAASPFGWQRYVADQQRIIAIDRFGFSGPGPLGL